MISDVIDEHLSALAAALVPFRRVAGRLPRWGSELAWALGGGGRLLAAGNGGSAAEAQHLTAELVGKLRQDRAPLSAIALCAETASLTAIGNDFGFDEAFARQVRAHGRPDDILLLLSTSGRSPNLLAAADAGRAVGMRVWGLTGPEPNPLASRCHQVVAVPSCEPQVVQELHLTAVHVLCEYVDLALPAVLGVADAYAGRPCAPVPEGVTDRAQGDPSVTGGARADGARADGVAARGGLLEEATRFAMGAASPRTVTTDTVTAGTASAAAAGAAGVGNGRSGNARAGNGRAGTVPGAASTLTVTGGNGVRP